MKTDHKHTKPNTAWQAFLDRYADDIERLSKSWNELQSHSPEELRAEEKNILDEIERVKNLKERFPSTAQTWVTLLDDMRVRLNAVRLVKILRATGHRLPRWEELESSDQTSVADVAQSGSLDGLQNAYRAEEHIIVAHEILSSDESLSTFNDFYKAAEKHRMAVHHAGGPEKYGRAIEDTLRNHMTWRGFRGFVETIADANSEIPENSEVRKYL